MIPPEDPAGDSPPTPEESAEAKKDCRRSLLKPAIVCGTAIIVLSLLHFTPLANEAMEFRNWRDHFDNQSWGTELAFAGIAALLIAAGIPRLIFFGIAGLLFGFVDGFCAAMLASMAGSYLSFSVVRWGFRNWVVERYGQRRFFQRVIRTESSVLSVFLIRQLPISNLFINVCLALTNITTFSFLAGSFLGFIPQGAAVVLIGSGVGEDVAWHGVVQLGAAAAVLYAISIIGWKFRPSRRQPTPPDPQP